MLEQALEQIIQDSMRKCHFRIDSLFDLDNRPDWPFFPDRTITNWLLIYARGGEGFYVINGDKHPIEQGRVLMIGHNVVHTAQHNPDNPASLLTIRFRMYDNTNDQPVIHAYPGLGFSVRSERHTLMHDLFSRVHQYYKMDDGPCTLAFCDALITEIFHYLLQDLRRIYGSSRPDSRIAKAKLRLEANRHRDIGLADIASSVGLTPRYFSKLFKEQTGMTYRQYVFQLRMQFARQMLTESDYTVKQVAEEIGYSDQFVFSRQFKQFHGVSPSNIGKESFSFLNCRFERN